MKKIEILIAKLYTGKFHRYIAVTSVRDGSELLGFAGTSLESVTNKATDYAIEHGYMTVDVKTTNNFKQYQDFIVKHLTD